MTCDKVKRRCVIRGESQQTHVVVKQGAVIVRVLARHTAVLNSTRDTVRTLYEYNHVMSNHLFIFDLFEQKHK